MILGYQRLFFLLPKAVGSPRARISAQTSSYFSSYSSPCFNTSSSFYSSSSFAQFSSFIYLFSFLTKAVSRNRAISLSSGLMLTPFFIFLSFSTTAYVETALTFMDMPSLRLCCGLLRWVIQARSHLKPSLQTSQKNTSLFLLLLFFYILPTYFQMFKFYYLPMSRLLCPFPSAICGCYSSSLQDLSSIVNFLRPHSSSSVFTVDFGFVLSAISYILYNIVAIIAQITCYSADEAKLILSCSRQLCCCCPLICIDIMVLFNQTFASGKQVIFPQNWHTGLTLLEMFQETRKSMPWLAAAKVIQLTVAFLWILLLYTIVMGLLEIFKVWQLPVQSHKRKEYRQVLKSESLFSILFVSIALIFLTALLTYKHEWIMWNLIQGLAIWVLVLAVKRAIHVLRKRR